LAVKKQKKQKKKLNTFIPFLPGDVILGRIVRRSTFDYPGLPKESWEECTVISIDGVEMLVAYKESSIRVTYRPDWWKRK
jgi:hypothetical protein